MVHAPQKFNCALLVTSFFFTADILLAFTQLSLSIRATHSYLLIFPPLMSSVPPSKGSLDRAITGQAGDPPIHTRPTRVSRPTKRAQYVGV